MERKNSTKKSNKNQHLVNNYFLCNLYRSKESLPELQTLAKGRIKYLERIVRDSEKRLHQVPKGTLGICKHGNKHQYYWNHSDDNNSEQIKRTYIKESEIDIAKSLAQKSYLKKVSSTSKQELKLLYSLVKLDSTPIESIYEKLPDFRKRLITPYAIPDSDYVKAWIEEPYQGSSFQDDVVYLTNKNERVRSKIEVNIANMLDKYKVPYKYEYPMSLVKGETIYPDFLCLNVRTRQEIIWEHFGMMDDIGYLRKNYAKLQFYQLHEYMLGKNLIATFETSKQPLDSRIIKATIESYLL